MKQFSQNHARLKSTQPGRHFRQAFDVQMSSIDKIINARGQSLLLEACEQCALTSTLYSPVAKLLLEKGADPNLLDWKGMNGLSYSLRRDNYELAFAILKQSRFKVDLNKTVEVNYINQKFKSSYLIFSVKNCSTALVRLLLDEGALINSVDEAGRNSLHFAVVRNDVPTIKLLLARGIEVNNADHNKVDSLKLVADVHNMSVVKLLLQNGASLTTNRKRGNKLLMAACDTGDIDLFDILIERGVGWHEQDESGHNVVMRAYLARQIDLSKIFLIKYNYRKSINAKDKKGNSLLMLAIQQEDADFVEFLLDNCPDLNFDDRNDAGKTALILAAELNLEEEARLLLPKLNSTQRNMTDANKTTALTWAVKNGNIGLVSEILSYPDTDTICRDALEKSPYDYAKTDALRFLIYHHQTTNKGKETDLKVSSGSYFLRDMQARLTHKPRGVYSSRKADKKKG